MEYHGKQGTSITCVFSPQWSPIWLAVRWALLTGYPGQSLDDCLQVKGDWLFCALIFPRRVLGKETNNLE